MKKEDIFVLFKKKPYLINMGAPTVCRRFNIAPADYLEARREWRMLQDAKSHDGACSITNTMPKILLLDIETAPLRAYVWSRWKQDVYDEQMISEWFIICWSAKWLVEAELFSDCVTSDEIKHENDSRVLVKLWELLNEADIVITHNGIKFDIPKINARFVVNGIMPPKPYKQIDTLLVAKKQFGFSSNKLNSLAKQFGVAQKMDTSFELWSDCMQGNPDALKYMLEYNKRDVYVLESVYLKIRSYVPNHPNLGVYLESDKMACGTCGSKELECVGEYVTGVSKYHMYRCKRCGSYSRMRYNHYDKEKRKNLLTTI